MDKPDERTDHAPYGRLSTDPDQSVVSIDAACKQILGYDIHGLRGARLESLLTRPSRIFYQIYFLPLIKLNGKIDNMQLSFKSSSGEEIPMLVHVATSTREGQERYDFILVPIQHESDSKNGGLK